MREEIVTMLLQGIGETLYMSVFATLFGYVIGLPWGVALCITGKNGIKHNSGIYFVLDVIANIMRSIPFLILMIMVIPLTIAIVGQSYGSTATIVPLVISAAPMIARMVESSLVEVDAGEIEAAQSMGAGTGWIILHVLLGEGRVSLIAGATISFATILGYSAMAGTLGGGGLGDIAIRYGYHRYDTQIMIITVVLLVVLVQIFQGLGTWIGKKSDKR
jgi:D-methionine transport system permease protein